jgi:hypothetical protein
MAAEAIRVPRRTQEAVAAPKPLVRRPARPGHGRDVLRFPGPEALLHPRAAEALILAFRPLSWSR